MPDELTISGYYAEAIQQFDATLDDVANAVAAVSSDKVRDILDRYKRATHQLLKAHRIQVIDDLQGRQFDPALLEQRLRNVEAQLGAHAEHDDDRGSQGT